MLTNCSAVLHAATTNQVALLRCGPGLGAKFGRRTEEVRSIEAADQRSLQILGFGVKEAGHSHGRGEQKVVESGHTCRQDHRCAADDICAGKDGKFI